MLTLCYLDEDSFVTLVVNPCGGGAYGTTFQPIDAYLGASFSGKSVKGDVSAKKVLDCLSAICALYGEHFVVRQYLPHAAELLFSSQRKLSPSLEAGSVGCMSLLHYILPYVHDATLMEHLQVCFY
jgi:WD repeat-containing protein 81